MIQEKYLMIQRPPGSKHRGIVTLILIPGNPMPRTARDLWHTITYEGTARFESNPRSVLEHKRMVWKMKEQQQTSDLPAGTMCPQCQKSFKARIGLISHLRVHKQND